MAGSSQSRPNVYHFIGIIVAMRSKHVTIALRSNVIRFVEVKFLRMQRLDARLQRNDTQVDVVKAANKKNKV